MYLKALKSVAIAILILSFSYQSKANFKITINVTNCKDGLKAYLATDISNREIINVIDSSALNTGVFKLEGNVDKPRFMTIYFLSDRHQKINHATPIIRLFVENSNIKIDVDFNNIPLYNTITNAIYPYNKIKITGSGLQTLLINFYDEMDASKTQYSLLFKNYVGYLKSVKETSAGSVSGGLKMIRPLDSIKMSTKKYVLAAIKTNEANPLGIFIAEKNMDRFAKKEIDSVYRRLNQHYIGTYELKGLKSKIDEFNRSSVGASFLDYEFQDTSGVSVKLSDYILKKKKYILLEFWASWDANSRKDILHLKTVYDLYRSSGLEVVAISLDNATEKWKKAIKEDGTPWGQLRNIKGFHPDLFRFYNFEGVPFAVLINPTGLIVDRDVRMFWVDKNLIALFGNKFGEMY